MLKRLNKSYFEITGNGLKNSSQLKGFNILEDTDKNKLLNIFRSYNIKVLDLKYFILHELDHEERWYNISYKYYETPYLWWIIPLVNNIENPFELPEPGTQLKILKNSYVYTILNEIKELGKR